MNTNLYDLQAYNRNKINQLLNSYCDDSVRQDPHLIQILDAISLIVSNYQQEEQQRSCSIMNNLLYNSSNHYGIHPEIVVGTLSGSKSTIIPNNTLLYEQDFLTSKYATYYYNVKIQQVYHKNGSLAIKLTLLDEQINSYNIKFFTNHHVLKSLFNVKPQIQCTIQQGNNDIDGIALIDYYDWVDLAYNHQNLQSFSVKFSLEEVNSQDILIILKLQEQLTLPYIPLNINQIILENRFLWISDNIDIQGPNKYTIRVPEQYKILNIQKLIVDERPIAPVSQDIDGWYVTIKNNTIILHINTNHTGVGVLSVEIANKQFLISRPYFVEENNCTVIIKSTCSRFFQIKETENLFLFYSLHKDKNSIQYLLQILKLYKTCAQYMFNIIKEEPIIVPSNHQGAVPIVKYMIHIESNCPYINLLYSISFYFQHKYDITWIYKYNTPVHDMSKIIEVF